MPVQSKIVFVRRAINVLSVELGVILRHGSFRYVKQAMPEPVPLVIQSPSS